jgi:hypothetical protein
MFRKELKDQCAANKKIDTRFQPKRKDVYNHVYNVVRETCQ